MNETASVDKFCSDCHFWTGQCRFHVNVIASSEACGDRFLLRIGNEYRTTERDYATYGGKARYLQTEMLKAVDQLEQVRKTLEGKKEQPHE
jgi:hypothetical protein